MRGALLLLPLVTVLFKVVDHMPHLMYVWAVHVGR